MKDFHRRNPTLIAGIAITSLIIAIICVALLVGARNTQRETLQRFDKIAALDELLGPKGGISERSKTEVDIIMRETPHALGAWVTRLNYDKTENPIIHSYFKNDVLKDAMDIYVKNQISGKGFSSAELNRSSSQSVRNSEEAKMGIIKCGSIETTNLPRIAPEILNVASGVCRATIPPFDENVNIAVVVITDKAADENSVAIQEVRRQMLRLQIDIFNRDYQGRETWAAPLGITSNDDVHP